MRLLQSGHVVHDNRLLLDLYACAGQPDRWSLVLDRLCNQTGARSAIVQAFRLDERKGVQFTWQMTDRRTAEQPPVENPRVSGADNPRFDQHRVMGALNRVSCDDDLFERHEPARESLRQGLAGIGLGEFLGALHRLPSGLLLGVALHRAVDDHRHFGAADVALLSTLTPHLAQACELGQELLAARAELRQLQQHADMLRCGLILCDEHAHVQWMNRAARSLTGSDGPLTLTGGVLRAHTPALSAQLHDELARAAHQGNSAARYIALGPPDRLVHLAMRARTPDADGRRSVMLAVTSAHAAIDVPAAAWSKLLGLTAAESALVTALTQGRTLDEHATLRGISLGTARNQLKQALTKTGTSRQVDLVRVALGSAAAHVLAHSPGHEA